MQPGVWIAMYLPIFVVLFVIVPSQRRSSHLAQKRRKKRGVFKLNNELLKRYIGKLCNISTGSYGTSYSKVTIVELVDNWIKVESKGKEHLINTDYIQSIRII